jgi:uncharacterized protein
MPQKQFLTARWTNLLMLNYEVDPAILKPFIPFATELDLWQGRALVSMVGFLFEDTRVIGIKWPLHVNFEEVNLRFYVKHSDGKEWKRGAVFISEIVPKKLIAGIANKLYREHYSAMPMRHTVSPVNRNVNRYAYEWKLNGKWNELSANIGNSFTNIQPGSQEEFIFEHYWGYNTWADTVAMEYQVEHIRWQTAEVSEPMFKADIGALYGEEFVPFLSREPYSAFFANGSEVIVRQGSKIRTLPTPAVLPSL